MDLILLVEDDPDLLEGLLQILTEAGYPVTAAASGDAAVLACQAAPPRLVLLDCHLPGEPSGAQLVTVLRALCTRDATIVAMSGELASAKSSGADHVLEKPFDIGVLLDTIQRLLDSTRGGFSV